ncbi:hypothetical protein [Pedobacter alpinus]|uniref:Uncharacterized protein n=1 Tax=Pedobacter alpinus TaxID=1590643 RepID=A0ABW5TPU5_9SPHI
MLKRAVKYIYSIILLVAITSASIPLHNIFHNHHFLPIVDCNLKFCENHIKSHDEHCHTFSDAVFIGNIPNIQQSDNFDGPFIDLIVNFEDKRYTKYLYFCRNKAPPVLIAA